jgi:glycerophosphoryl diester phosphodiesterase
VKPLVIAHRGASAVELENSLAAFRAAAKAGADAVELDVHATADGELIVHHDGVVDGLHIPRVRASVLAELRLPNGEPIPTLKQVLDVLGPAMRVFVEVKTLDAQWDERLFKALDAGPNPTGYAVHSFSAHIIRRLGDARPNLRRGMLSEAYPRQPKTTLKSVGATTLWQERSFVDEVLIRAVHSAGAEIIVWTVDDQGEMARLVAWGVDGICTNYPERARRAVDAPQAA